MPSLRETQERLWQLIAAPEGVGEALAAEGRAGDDLAGWVVSDARLPGRARLDIYANAYFERIHGCLREDFGALAAAIGDDGFHDLVTGYLLAFPSRTPSLRHVGASLSMYLRNEARAEAFRRRWPWAADLAEIEWLLGLAFDAADAAPLTREALSEIETEDWESLVFRFAPATRLAQLEWPMRATYLSWTRGEEMVLPDEAASEAICIWRRDEIVRHRALDGNEARALLRARAGATFGELCADAVDRAEGEDPAAVVAGHLGRWVDDGLLAGAASD